MYGGQEEPQLYDVTSLPHPGRELGRGAGAYSSLHVGQDHSRNPSGGAWSDVHQAWPAPQQRAAVLEQRAPSLGQRPAFPWQRAASADRPYSGNRHPAAAAQQADAAWLHQTASQVTQMQHPRLCEGSSAEPDYSQHQHGKAQSQHAGTCSDWSAGHQVAQPNRQLPGRQVSPAQVSSHRHVGRVAREQTGPSTTGHADMQGMQNEQQRAVGGEVAAMEAVLSEYKALRAQIVDAEAQLAVLQGSEFQGEGSWSPGYTANGYQYSAQNDQVHGDCYKGAVHPGKSDGCLQLAAVIDTLTLLKAAAARQRPAVEAVASQLRSTLSRGHA